MFDLVVRFWGLAFEWIEIGASLRLGYVTVGNFPVVRQRWALFGTGWFWSQSWIHEALVYTLGVRDVRIVINDLRLWVISFGKTGHLPAEGGK